MRNRKCLFEILIRDPSYMLEIIELVLCLESNNYYCGYDTRNLELIDVYWKGRKVKPIQPQASLPINSWRDFE